MPPKLLNYIQLAENYVLISVGNLFFSHFYANSRVTGRKLFKKEDLVKNAVFP